MVANFQNSDYTEYRIGVPQDTYWREALNSQHIHYDGSGQVNGGTLIPDQIPYDGYSQSLTIDLPRMAFVVLQAGTAQTSIEDESPHAALDRLEPSFPNPFNPAATIRFSLAESRHAALCIYDVSGRLVRTLIDETLHGGPHEVRWDGRNERGGSAASGIYFYRLVTAGFTETRRMVLLR